MWVASFAVSAADKNSLTFSAKPVSAYPAKQTNDKVTVAAAPFDTDALAQSAFGKSNPNRFGVLPMLIVIRNDSPQTIYLENIRVEYVTLDRKHVEATPAKDVPYVNGPSKPKYDAGPVPAAGRVRRKKNPLATGIIDVRAFSARMLPPGQSASGFFYFQTGHRRDASAYITGIREANSGKELFYYEIPLSGASQ